MRTLEQVIGDLPPTLRDEVHDFASFLLERKVQPKRGKLRMTWAGGLREFRDRFTALELQNKSKEWWED